MCMVVEKNPNETTHRRISYKNIERILRIGKMGDSFNDVITMLLDEYEERHGITGEKESD